MLPYSGYGMMPVLMLIRVNCRHVYEIVVPVIENYVKKTKTFVCFFAPDMKMNLITLQQELSFSSKGK